MICLDYLEKMKRHIYLFLDNYPFASAGLIYGLEMFAENFVVKTYYPSSYQSRRMDIDSNSILQQCYEIDYSNDLIKFEKKEGNNLLDAVYVSFGYTNNSFVWAEKFSSKYKCKLIVIAERPTIISKSNFVKKSLLFLKHKFLYLKLKNKINALLAMGNVGVEYYRRLGWKNNKVYDFCYCPLIFERNIVPFNDFELRKKFELVFVYSGRFSYSKGIWRLLDYFKNHPNHCLIVIGDYGKDRDSFLSTVNGFENIFCVGKKTIHETIGIYKYSDCILIPSVVDGWNVNVNLALIANTPVVITDKCGSDEVISSLKNGVVTKNNLTSFTNGIENFNNEKEKYFLNASKDENKDVLSSKSIADYFIAIIKQLNDKKNYDEQDGIKAPWNN